jgi:hypothetical protein
MVTGRSDVTCLAAVLVLSGSGCGEASHGLSQPFVANGGIEGGLGSGLWGDTSSGPDGEHLGCIPGRHYAQAITLRNRSTTAVTLTDARGSEPAPHIIRRVAVQFRLAPPPPHGDIFVSNLRRWSASPPTPVTIPPGRSAAVQSNFLMGQCYELAARQVLTVNDAIVVDYRASGKTGQQEIAQRSARILLSRGPAIRECAVPRDTHVLKLRTLDLACGVARRLSVACRGITHGRSGTSCGFAGRRWGCNWIPRPRSRVVESCFANTSSIRAVWSR